MSGAMDRCRERIREYLDTPIEGGATPKLTKEEYERRARAIQAPPPGTPSAPPLRTYYDPSNPGALSAPGAPIPYGQVVPASGGPALAWGQGPAMQPEGPSVAQPYGYVPGIASVVPNQAIAWGQEPMTAPQVQAAAAKVVAAAPAELRNEAQAAAKQAAFASTPAEVAAAKLAVERVADQANAGSKLVVYSAIGVGALGILGFMIYLARKR